jgi:hypothetical protein
MWPFDRNRLITAFLGNRNLFLQNSRLWNVGFKNGPRPTSEFDGTDKKWIFILKNLKAL